MSAFLSHEWIIILIAVFLVLGLGGRFAWRVVAKVKGLRQFRKERERSLTELEKRYEVALQKLGESRAVIEVIHDWSNDMLGPAGLPYGITDEEAFEIVRQIKVAQDLPISVILHTIGGFSQATYLIAKALGQHRGGAICYVPYLAMSGGTVIALATEEIVMGEAASLGPIDTLYWGWPIGAFESVERTKNPDEIDDFVIMASYVAHSFEKDAVERAKRFIHANHGPNVTKELIESGRYHGDTVSKEEAQRMQLRVPKRDCPDEVYKLVDAKLGIVALERAEIAKRYFDLPTTKGTERAQQVHGVNVARLRLMTIDRLAHARARLTRRV
jgi:Sec-independent protein translocase protein TatA